MDKLKVYNVGSVEIANAVNELIENHDKLSFRVNTLIGLVETDLEHEKGLTKELNESIKQLTKALGIAAKELYIKADGNTIVGEKKDNWIKYKIEEWLGDAKKIK
jgi:hypothetical protein